MFAPIAPRDARDGTCIIMYLIVQYAGTVVRKGNLLRCADVRWCTLEWRYVSGFSHDQTKKVIVFFTASFLAFSLFDPNAKVNVISTKLLGPLQSLLPKHKKERNWKMIEHWADKTDPCEDLTLITMMWSLQKSMKKFCLQRFKNRTKNNEP